MLSVGGTSQRAQMRNFKLLCQDTIEYITDLLSKDESVRLLFGQLQDLGWKEGDQVIMRHG